MVRCVYVVRYVNVARCVNVVKCVNVARCINVFHSLCILYMHVYLICVCVLGGFLIRHASKGVCLTVQGGKNVVLRSCDVKNSSQDWSWTEDRKLKHTQSAMCLWGNTNLDVPSHARLVKTCPCNSAPAWKCYDEFGTFGLEMLPLYLKKQGDRAVVRSEPKHSNWIQYTGRKLELTHLCSHTGIVCSGT